MDVEQYAVARRRLLVEHAVASGVDPDQAPVLVDRVLAEQRGRIARAADPHPDVVDALDRAIRGPWRHRRTATTAAVAATALAVVAGLGWWWTRPPEQVVVPSAFALDASGAAAALDRAGLQARISTTVSCEPEGLVVGSSPPAGAEVDTGSTVELTTAVPPVPECAETDRAAAWAFLRFVRGGPAPRLAPTVYVIYDGRDPAVLPAAAAADPQRWASIQDVADAAARTPRGATDASGLPTLVVTSGTPPPEQCGTARPASAGERPTLRLQLLTTADERCPLTVDLYRSADRVIDAVVVYPAGG